MTIQEIDERIVSVLTKLEMHRNLEDGFETYKLNPNSDQGLVWVKELKNTFLPANVLLPLTLVRHPKAMQMLSEEYKALEKNKSTFGFWHYFNDRMAFFFIPFETDTNSLMSYVGSFLHKPVLSKQLFYQQASATGYLNLWFLPRKVVLWSNPLSFFDIWRTWIKGKNFPAFKANVIVEDDAEFCVTANNLLYLGDNENTKGVVQKLMSDVVSPEPVRLIYYPNQTIAHYLLARSSFYGKIDAFKQVMQPLEQKIQQAYTAEVDDSGKHLNILTASTLLMMDSSMALTEKSILKSWEMYEDAEVTFPFYCSNSFTDFNVEKQLHNAYFGGPSLTLAFYLEFLSLLRFRRFGSFYGMQ